MLFCVASRVAVRLAIPHPHIHANGNHAGLTNAEQAYVLVLASVLAGLVVLLIFLIGERRW